MAAASLPSPTRRALCALLPLSLFGACATQQTTPPAFREPEGLYRAVNRIGWGATQAQLDQARELGWGAYVERQLRAEPRLPLPQAAAQAQIDALSITRQGLAEQMSQVEQLRREQDKAPDEEGRKAARQAYQELLNRLAREAAHRQLLRQLYSEQQLQEQLAWFWFNHFNVHQYKRELRALLADYEDAALRPQALGSFRALLGAVARHPAMLRYLDNDQNSVGKPNENYARELLELHTLGVDGGYTQRDVQELARVLTGFGTRFDHERPRLKPGQEAQYLRQGFFEFNPARHDFGDKQLLGRTIKGRGAAELDEVLDLLAGHPSTARFIARKLAVYLLADEPPPALVEQMARAFERGRGDIGASLRVLLLAPEFAAAEPRKFKDPQHYLLSGLRAAYGSEAAPVISNSQPLQSWLRRLGQGLYDRATPDGYAPSASAWNSAGQLSTRFELARNLAAGPAALFNAAAGAAPRPLLARAPRPPLGEPTCAALARAASPLERDTLLLSSPEFMYR
ncbi:DUF1800 domain-containing protein [Roseateles sp. DAIF2]|nr:DUF1800 domain-containing protein [Roseateles sp. DAIF2]